MIIFQTTGTLRNESLGRFCVSPTVDILKNILEEEVECSLTMAILRIEVAEICVVSPQSQEF